MLKASFRPEFLNRLDEIVFFKPLVKEQVEKIVELLSEELKKRLEEKQLYLSMTQAAVDYIVDRGYDPVYGARKRLFRRRSYSGGRRCKRAVCQKNSIN